MADSSLQAIQTKVRRLTRSPSTDLLSDADLNQYINTFVLYDFPEHLRLFNLKQNFSFYSSAFTDTYSTTTANPNDPLYNFKNRYITTHKPVYIAGYLSFFSQSEQEFYGVYPRFASIQQAGSGDGATTTFTGVINLQQNTPAVAANTVQNLYLLQNNVLFNSLDINGNTLTLIDQPISVYTGNLIVPNNIIAINGSINYMTGEFTLIFPTPPAAGAIINSQTVQYTPSRPLMMLYFADQFILRPVPDQSYKIEMEVYVRPTELLSTNQSPDLEQWWQYIAYGAAKKVLEDRMDFETVQLIMPEFKEQELLVQRTTIVQRTKQRSATIYTNQVNGWNFQGGWGWGGGIQ